MIDISINVLEKNLHLIGRDEDYWVGQRISRGVDKVGGEQWDLDGGPTVIVECAPLPLKPRASLYESEHKSMDPSQEDTFSKYEPTCKNT